MMSQEDFQGRELRCGVRIAVDVGTVRIGIARSDPNGVLTFPVKTLLRRDDGGELDELIALVREYGAMEVIVGLPRHLKGTEGISAKGARRYARRISQQLPGIRVAMVDERLSSQSAHERLRISGVPTSQHKAMIDQVAAQVILELALDQERVTGRPPGASIHGDDNKHYLNKEGPNYE